MSEKKGLSHFAKNKENPFMESAIEVINNNIVKRYRNSTNTGEKAILSAIDSNGEVLGHTSFVRQIEVDEEQFTKFYLSQFSSFWSLKSTTLDYAPIITALM